METVYKVCKVSESGRYKSYLYGDADNRLIRDYAIDLETLPEFGFLFAFRHFENALEFLKYGPRGDLVVVFECVARTASPDAVMVTFPYYRVPAVHRAGYEGCRSFWTGFHFDGDIMIPMPEGTILCSSITPLKFVLGGNNSYEVDHTITSIDPKGV